MILPLSVVALLHIASNWTIAFMRLAVGLILIERALSEWRGSAAPSSSDAPPSSWRTRTGAIVDCGGALLIIIGWEVSFAALVLVALHFVRLLADLVRRALPRERFFFALLLLASLSALATLGGGALTLEDWLWSRF